MGTKEKRTEQATLLNSRERVSCLPLKGKAWYESGGTRDAARLGRVRRAKVTEDAGACAPCRYTARSAVRYNSRGGSPRLFRYVPLARNSICRATARRERGKGAGEKAGRGRDRRGRRGGSYDAAGVVRGGYDFAVRRRTAKVMSRPTGGAFGEGAVVKNDGNTE